MSSTAHPDLPTHPIHVHKTERVNPGRFVSLQLDINTDGRFFGRFTVTNMQALAGYHGDGHVDFLDRAGNIVARIRMPRLGVKPAFFAKHYSRHHHFEGRIKPEHLGTIGGVAFAGYENADGSILKDIQSVLTVFESLTGA
jgi:hypothetical protein